MHAASPVRRTSLVLTILAGVQAVAVAVIGVKALPGDPTADPFGPFALFIALLFLLLAGADAAAAAVGVFWTRREAPLTARSRFGWMVWVVVAMFVNVASAALLLAAVFLH